MKLVANLGLQLLNIQLLLIQLPQAAFTTEFVTKPMSYNATENQVVTFNCTISDANSRIIWQVNGDGLSADSNIHRQIIVRNFGIRVSVLTIPAIPQNNNVRIHCGLYPYSSSNPIAQEVVLRIQGLLSAPPNVTALAMCLSIHISWTAPDTLDLTKIEPDISYYVVTVQNVLTGGINTTNVTTTEHTYMPDSYGKYEVTIAAVNAVGVGDRSDAILTYIVPILTSSNTNRPHNMINSTEVKVSRVDDSISLTCTTHCPNTVSWLFTTSQIDHEPTSEISADDHVNVSYTVPLSCREGDEQISAIKFEAQEQLNGTTIRCFSVAHGTERDSRPYVCLSNAIVLSVLIAPSKSVQTMASYPKSTDNDVVFTTYSKVSDMDTTIVTAITKSYYHDTDRLTTSQYMVAIGSSSKSLLVTIGISTAGGVCILILILAVIGLICALAVLAKKRHSSRLTGQESCTSSFPNAVYDSIVTIATDKDGGNSHYSLPLPTDPCPAYQSAQCSPGDRHTEVAT